MTTHGRAGAGWWVAALLMLALLPRSAAGITLALRDVADPVPPGGILTYEIRVSGSGGGDDGAVVCFNPPPECITFPAECLIGDPLCVGNSFTGYVCGNAANDGANCGVGDPPLPDVTLCVPKTTGICSGGQNAGFPCSSNADCTGETFVCQHAFNDGAFCGTGNPPQADPSFCVANPTGICSGGPNLGLPCTAPHDTVTDECPPNEGDPATDEITITLGIPSNTSFLDADNDATSDGEKITWTLDKLDPCGSAGLPRCPLFTARLTVALFTPVGTIIENTAYASGPAGSAESGTPKTTVGTFRLRRFVLAKAKKKEGRDQFIYRAVFTLGAEAEIDPNNEPLRVQVETPSGQPLLDLGLPAGSLLPFSSTGFKFVSPEPGLNRVLVRELAPSHYRLNLNATRLTCDVFQGYELVVTLTVGDDIMVHPVSLLVRNAGRKFVGLNN